MKQSHCFECVLLKQEMELSEQWQEAFEKVRAGVDKKRLNQYLCRQVRRHMKKLHTDAPEGFTASERAYCYDDYGIYIPKLPQSSKAGINKRINNSVSMWQKRYVRSRLTQKCQEQSIALIDVRRKDISSGCGAAEEKRDGVFCCIACDIRLPKRENAAKNALKRGQTGS